MEEIKNFKEQEKDEKQEYYKKVEELCKANKDKIDEMREKINTWDDPEYKQEILSLLKDIERSYTDPSFINDAVTLDILMSKRKLK